jgi:hypothetical protein
MALIEGIHFLAKGDKVEARKIAQDIQQNQRLLVGHNTAYGAGVYAWYRHSFPSNLQSGPHVLFEVDDKRITEIFYRNGISRGFFIIPR